MISVCIATYNGEAFIKQQLLSILNQLSSNDEVIVSDDHSTDNTLNIIKNLYDSRVRVFTNNVSNSGVIGNFENAIFNSRGDFIFLADQDDIWLNNKVEVMSRELERGFTLVLSNCTIIDCNNEVLEESYFKFRGTKIGFFYNLYKNSFMGSCIAFKKELTFMILPFPKNIPMHDSWIGLSAYFFGKVSFIEESLMYYRKHDNFSDTASGISRYTFFHKVKFRIILLSSLLKRQILFFSQKK